MKRLTLDLIVTEKSVFILTVKRKIIGNIEPVIEILGSNMYRDNILVDIRSFRCHNGTYEIKSRNGLLGHTRVLDILNKQSGLLMLRPGEVVTFYYMDQYILFFNQLNPECNAYLGYIVSKQKIKSYLDKTLERLRKGLIKKHKLILNHTTD
jgi:hypothetical protein